MTVSRTPDAAAATGTTDKNDSAIAWLSTAGQLAAVSAVVMPLVGALVRGVAFATDARLPSPGHLAVSAPAGDLAMTGVLVSLPTMAVAVAVALIVWRGRIPARFEVSLRAELALLALSSVAVGAVCYVPTGNLALVVVSSVGYVTGELTPRIAAFVGRPGPGRVGRLIVVTGVVAVVTGIASGLIYSPAPAASYRFVASTAGPRDGWYVPLGETAGLALLHPCAPDAASALIEVPESAIALVVAPDPGGSRATHLGINYSCP